MKSFVLSMPFRLVTNTRLPPPLTGRRARTSSFMPVSIMRRLRPCSLTTRSTWYVRVLPVSHNKTDRDLLALPENDPSYSLIQLKHRDDI
jgi:hypothetical protein